MGKSQLLQPYNWVSFPIAGGPNQGFKYLTSPPSNNSTYRWVITQQLDDTSGQFYQAQCGDYHPQTNPNGFIGGAALRSNTIHHESANAPNSHYYQYRVAQDSPSNNIGLALEAVVASPTEDFQNKSESVINQKANAIQAARQVEPCGGFVNRDHSTPACTELGKVNFSPYQPCN